VAYDYIIPLHQLPIPKESAEKLTALIKPGRKLDKSVAVQRDHLHIRLSLSSIPILTPRIEGDGNLLQNTSTHQLIDQLLGNHELKMETHENK
jgi:hypothetical protein